MKEQPQTRSGIVKIPMRKELIELRKEGENHCTGHSRMTRNGLMFFTYNHPDGRHRIKSCINLKPGGFCMLKFFDFPLGTAGDWTSQSMNQDLHPDECKPTEYELSVYGGVVKRG